MSLLADPPIGMTVRHAVSARATGPDPHRSEVPRFEGGMSADRYQRRRDGQAPVVEGLFVRLFGALRRNWMALRKRLFENRYVTHDAPNLARQCVEKSEHHCGLESVRLAADSIARVAR